MRYYNVHKVLYFTVKSHGPWVGFSGLMVDLTITNKSINNNLGVFLFFNSRNDKAELFCYHLYYKVHGWDFGSFSSLRFFKFIFNCWLMHLFNSLPKCASHISKIELYICLNWRYVFKTLCWSSFGPKTKNISKEF